MNTAIFNGKASMTSVEIAELVGSQHSDVKRSIERLVAKNIIRKPPMAVSEKINNLGFKVQYEHYLFEGEQGIGCCSLYGCLDVQARAVLSG